MSFRDFNFQISHKNIQYLCNGFSTTLKDLLKYYLDDCFIFVLIYLPEDESRKKFRKINKLICDSRYLTVYWFKDPQWLTDNEPKFIVKREYREFVILWFDLLLELEDSPMVVSLYNHILTFLHRKTHVQYIVIHQSYIIIENIKIPMHLNAAINLFL